MELPLSLAIGGFLVVVVLVFIYLSVRIVQQYERLVVFRLGRTDEALTRGPGIRFLIPIVDRPVRVDLRETLTEFPSQRTITGDNAPIDVDVEGLQLRAVDRLSAAGAGCSSCADAAGRSG